MEYHVHTLPNGIRLLHVPAASAISHACIILNSGSRHEPDDKHGLAHLAEHLLFKRTERRNTNQILNRLESVGADLNAYTTKEYTCVHASFLQPYLNRTLDLFNDVVFHSVFPEEEIIKEKHIVLDEIASYQDQPEEAIYDDFEDLLFAGHTLGHNILGTAEAVNGISRNDLLRHVRSYRTDEIIVAVLGNYSLKQFVAAGEKHFMDVPENRAAVEQHIPEAAPVVQLIQERPIAQAHYVMGKRAYSLYHPHKTGLHLLNNHLGGNGMSAVLNLQVREKHGIAYTIESNYSPLTDTGLFSIYFGTEREKVEKAVNLIHREFRKLRSSKMTEIQLHRTKEKFIGQIALGEENRIGLIISMAKSLVNYNTIDDLETVFKKIRTVTAENLLEISNDILDEQAMTTLGFFPSA